jgi:hypothetical protein
MNTIPHLSAIAIITIIMGLIYCTVQQNYRSSANDPQVEIAHELRGDILKGNAVPFDDSVEMETSLSVFKEAYDKNGNPLMSTGYLNGKVPRLPKGVFEHAKATGEHWLTWQPQQNVRMATGIVYVNMAPIAYLVVGRSLNEVEKRVASMGKMIFMGWLLCICVVVVNWLVTFYHYNRKDIVHGTK